VLSYFPESPGQIARARTDGSLRDNAVYGKMNNVTTNPEPRIETNKLAARFFYCAKASGAERNAGLEGMEERVKVWNGQSQDSSEGKKPVEERWTTTTRNHHPTVKPISLMRYLCRLTRTPTDGVILDPFAGSGSTGVAAMMEGRDFIGIEIDPDYCEIAVRRMPRQRSLWQITAPPGEPQQGEMEL